MRTFLLSSSSNSPGRFSGRDFQGGEGIGRSSGSLITRNGVCFAVSVMRIDDGGRGAVSTSDSSGVSGRRSSQRAGARTYGAGPLVFEERGGMREEAKGLFAPLSLFVHHMARSIFNRDSATHSPSTIYPISPILSYPDLLQRPICSPPIPPYLNPSLRTRPSSFTWSSITRSKMGTKPEKKK